MPRRTVLRSRLEALLTGLEECRTQNTISQHKKKETNRYLEINLEMASDAVRRALSQLYYDGGRNEEERK